MDSRSQRRPAALRFQRALRIAPAGARVWLMIGLAAALATHSCAVIQPRPLPPKVDVTGFWEGRSMGGCTAWMPGCGARVRITLSMIQNHSQVTGTYTCASNTLCRNLDTRGRIAVGRISGPGVSLRVMFEDVSSCIFNGTFSDTSGAGAYICLQGGGVVDRGYWEVKRAYGPVPPPAWWTG